MLQGNMIKILKRTVKQKKGLRIFQTRTLESMKKSNNKIIIVEAPVGSGKSFIIKKIIEDEKLSGNPIILTYPTKILMNSQISSLKKQFKNVVHWPDENESKGNLTIFEYSSDSIFRYLKTHPNINIVNKSELIHKVLLNQQYLSNKNVFVTTPDVLHLIKNGWYRSASWISSYLNQAIVVFDEFHLYTNLENFAPLIHWLLDNIASKILFLSASPTYNRELKDIINKQKAEFISFEESVGGDDDFIFNYPLDLFIEEFKYTKRDELLKKLNKYIPVLPKPLCIIFDSIFRLRHLKPYIVKNFGQDYSIIEYSGMFKQTGQIDEKSIILGTSSIEVGMELPIKSLITEAGYWTSAIQRLGRVGRFQPAKAVLFIQKRLYPYLRGIKKISRTKFENEVLKKALKDQQGGLISGEMFRGDSLPFLFIDSNGEFFPYSEAIFSMFDITNRVNNWKKLSPEQKAEVLHDDFNLDRKDIEEVLLRDKIFPFVGVVSGRLNDKYLNIKKKVTTTSVRIEQEETGRSFFFDI